MRRAFLTIIALASILTPAITATASAAAKQRCPVKMPETLLSLYRQSDAIFVARYDKKEYGEVTRSTDDYSVVEVKTSFDVSSVLKGETRKFVVLSDDEYQYKLPPEDQNEPEQQAVFIEDIESFDMLTQPKPGDTVLLFLKKEEEGPGLSLSDYRDGIKKLSAEHLAVYVDRINELNSIFTAKKVDPSEITEWLIRCAENPATRWEGAFELLRAFQRLDWQESRAEERRQKAARGEVINDDDDAIDEESSLYETVAYARALTDYQKAALSNILLNRNYQSPDATGQNSPRFIRGDRELIELVKRWGDNSLAQFLLDQLKSGAFSPSDNSQIMDTIAEMIDDPKTSSLAEKFSEIAYEEDEAIVEEEDRSESEDQTIEAEETNSADGATSEPADEAEAEKPDAKAPNSKKPSYKELREELLTKFIARSEKVLSKQESLPAPTN